MESKPMVSMSKNSISFTPAAFDLLLSYIKYFIYQRQVTLDQYRRQRGAYRALVSDDSPQPVDDIATLQREIEQAQALVRDFEHVKEWLQCTYKWRFERLADVLRKSRIHLGQDQIENMYSLKVVLVYLMEMLKEENRMFSREQFITYINEGK